MRLCAHCVAVHFLSGTLAVSSFSVMVVFHVDVVSGGADQVSKVDKSFWGGKRSDEGPAPPCWAITSDSRHYANPFPYTPVDNTAREAADGGLKIRPGGNNGICLALSRRLYEILSFPVAAAMTAVLWACLVSRAVCGLIVSARF